MQHESVVLGGESWGGPRPQKVLVYNHHFEEGDSALADILGSWRCGEHTLSLFSRIKFVTVYVHVASYSV